MKKEDSMNQLPNKQTNNPRGSTEIGIPIILNIFKKLKKVINKYKEENNFSTNRTY